MHLYEDFRAKTLQTCASTVVMTLTGEFLKTHSDAISEASRFNRGVGNWQIACAELDRPELLCQGLRTLGFGARFVGDFVLIDL